MEVFRIAHASFADLSGNGGLHNKGRWHNKGRPIVYTSGSRSLSMLERYIHEDGRLPLPNLVMMSIHLPDETPIESISVHHLNNDWFSHDEPAQEQTRQLGDNWLIAQQTPVLKIPSSIVPQEFNYLINPFIAQRHSIKVIDLRKYQYEDRYHNLITNI